MWTGFGASRMKIIVPLSAFRPCSSLSCYSSIGSSIHLDPVLWPALVPNNNSGNRST